MSDVRPLLTVATYLDDQTGFEIYQEVRLTPCWLGGCAALHSLVQTAVGGPGAGWHAGLKLLRQLAFLSNQLPQCILCRR